MAVHAMYQCRLRMQDVRQAQPTGIPARLHRNPRTAGPNAGEGATRGEHTDRTEEQGIARYRYKRQRQRWVQDKLEGEAAQRT